MPDANTAVVTATLGLRVRTNPDVTNSRIVALLPHGARVRVLEQNAGWAKIAFFADISGQAQVSTSFGWASLQWLSFPAPTSSVKVGVNILNRHEAVGYAAGEAGARFFMVLNNPGFASALKTRYPDATVMVRIWWDSHMPSVDQAIARMDGCNDGRLVYTGLNEADECAQDYDGIRKRAAFDVEMATKIKAISGARYAAGTFSMGTPDYTAPYICAIMRDLYAPHYNSGLLDFDYHSYSPSMRWTNEDPIWYATRWRFLFTQCGFDPKSRSRVYSSETGVDEQGMGGFPAHGATPEQVLAWAKWYREIQAARVGADESPFVGGAIFQVGDWDRWLGYNVEAIYSAMKEGQGWG